MRRASSATAARLTRGTTASGEAVSSSVGEGRAGGQRVAPVFTGLRAGELRIEVYVLGAGDMGLREKLAARAGIVHAKTRIEHDERREVVL